MQEVRDFIVGYLRRNNSLESVSDDLDFVEMGYINSMELFLFTVELEERFGITLSEGELASTEFRTVGGLSRMVSRKMEPGEDE